MNNKSNENVSQPLKTKLWLIILLIVILLATGALFTWYFLTKNTKNTQKETSPTTNEIWEKNSVFSLKNITSSDTHKISDGVIRMFYQKDGNIVYSESSNGKTFSEPMQTGISQDDKMMLSNPAVIQTKDGKWIMLYEQSPQKGPDQKGKTLPGPATQRNLYLATSDNGAKFTKEGIAIDSSKEDNYFASVPDLVLLPDGKIRAYYVSGGEAIGSQISEDNGKTWKRESGYRLADQAVDPDVIIQEKDGKTKWVMYYSILDPTNNALYKAVSNDGLKWESVGKVLDKQNPQGSIVDPDVVEISKDNYYMYFGEFAASDSTASGDDQPGLFYASYKGDIFK